MDIFMGFLAAFGAFGLAVAAGMLSGAIANWRTSRRIAEWIAVDDRMPTTAEIHAGGGVRIHCIDGDELKALPCRDGSNPCDWWPVNFPDDTRIPASRVTHWRRA